MQCAPRRSGVVGREAAGIARRAAQRVGVAVEGDAKVQRIAAHFLERDGTDVGECGERIAGERVAGEIADAAHHRVDLPGAHAGSGELGAEAIRELLRKMNVPELGNQLRERMKKETSQQNRKKITKRLRIVEAFLNSGNRPEW